MTKSVSELKSVLAGLVLAVGLPFTAVAEMAAPLGEVILTISGDISETNAGETAQLDIALLEMIGKETFSTTTIWTEGEQEFTGTPLVDLMQALGVEDGMLLATAINDYTVEIPVSDAVEGGPMIAYLRNGETMPVRDKGPLWVVYPWSDKSEYQSEVYYSRSIWQLDRIEVRQ